MPGFAVCFNNFTSYTAWEGHGLFAPLGSSKSVRALAPEGCFLALMKTFRNLFQALREHFVERERCSSADASANSLSTSSVEVSICTKVTFARTRTTPRIQRVKNLHPGFNLQDMLLPKGQRRL